MDVAELLVSHGASLNAKTFLEETPIGRLTAPRLQELIHPHTSPCTPDLLSQPKNIHIRDNLEIRQINDNNKWCIFFSQYRKKFRKKTLTEGDKWSFLTPHVTSCPLRPVRGRGVQSHPAGPETQARQHHEVSAQTQDLAVQANVQRRESWVSVATCWRFDATTT